MVQYAPFEKSIAARRDKLPKVESTFSTHRFRQPNKMAKISYLRWGTCVTSSTKKLSFTITPSKANYHSLLHLVLDNSATRATKLEELQSLAFSTWKRPANNRAQRTIIRPDAFKILLWYKRCRWYEQGRIQI